MSDNQNKENKMGVMPVGRLVFSMSWPMVASMLFQAFYNIVDSVFVARLNQDAMNAVSISFPLQMLVIAFAAGTGVGMNAILSRSLGQKDYEKANRVATTSIFLYLCTAIVFMIMAHIVAEPFFRFQTDNAQIIAYGTDYIHVCIGLSITIFMQVCAERLLQSTGRTNLSMVSQITGAVINMILDPILIFGLFGFPRLEVKGAAVATVCGQFIAAIIGFTLNVKKNKEITLKISQIFRPVGAIVSEVYKIAIPTIVMQAVGSVMNFLLNKILIGFTEAATAAFGAYYKIQSFIFMPVFGMNTAIVPILGYNYGARKNDRLIKTIKISIFSAITIMCIGTVLFETIPGRLIGLFSPTEEMLHVGIRAFRIIGIHFPVAGFCIASISTFQALGKPVYSLIVSLCRQLLVLLPSAYLLSLLGVLDNVWFAFLIAEVVSLILCAFFLRRLFRIRGLSKKTEGIKE